MIVYQVLHRRPRGGRTTWPLVDEKLIGFFTTAQLADDAIEASRSLEGFREWPDGFAVEAVVVDNRRFPQGFDVQADLQLIPDD